MFLYYVKIDSIYAMEIVKMKCMGNVHIKTLTDICYKNY